MAMTSRSTDLRETRKIAEGRCAASASAPIASKNDPRRLNARGPLADEQAKSYNAVEQRLREVFAGDVGGQVNQRGLMYQHLYVIRLIRDILDGTIDEYACECGRDYLAWKFGAGQDPLRLTLIEVKSSLQDSVLLDGKMRSFIEGLASRCHRLATNYPQASLKARLVYSPVRGDDHIREQRIFDLAQTVVWPDHCEFEIEGFVPITLPAENLRQELQFLDVHAPGITGVLFDSSQSGHFLERLLGLTIPAYTPACIQSLFGKKIEQVLTLGQPHQDAATAVETLRKSLRGLLDYATNPEAQLPRHRSAAFKAAESRLLVAPGGLPTETDQNACSWNIGAGTDAVFALAALELISEHDRALPRCQGVYKNAQAFGVSFDFDGMIPLREYLASSLATHSARVRLLRSFAETMCRWSSCGLMITDAFVTAHHRWLVNLSDPVPRFVAGGLAGVIPFDPMRGLLDHHWVHASPLADAIRILYYGESSLANIRQTSIFQAPWNDNIVANLADFIQSLIYLKAREFLDLIAKVFRSELDCWPLFITHSDSQFTRDIVNAGKLSALGEMCAAHPEAWLIDSGRYHEEIVYTRCGNEGQIGLINNGDLTFSAYRYFRYGMERWMTHLVRDRAAEVSIDFQKSHIGFVPLSDPKQLASIVEEVFDIPHSTYRLWHARELKKLENRKLTVENRPECIIHEENLHKIRKCRLDTLRRSRFRFRVCSEADKELLMIDDGRRFMRCLERCGFDFGVSDLRVTARDSEENTVRGDVLRLEVTPSKEVLLRIETDPEREGHFPSDGSLQVTDPGLDAVLQGDQSLFNELSDFFQPKALGNAEAFLPAALAWKFVRELVGDSSPSVEFSRVSLWNGTYTRPNRIGLRKLAKISSETILETIASQPWQIITGAPGTGKTRIVAEAAARYLDKHISRQFPPCRVLVVANTHWAVDNFVRTFRAVNRGRWYAVCRPTPRQRYDGLRNDGAVDSALIASLEDEFQTHVWPHIPKSPTPLGSSLLVEKHRLQLASQLEQIRSMEDTAQNAEHCCIVPSHLKWLQEEGFIPRLFPNELKQAARLIQEKLDALPLISNRVEEGKQCANWIGLDIFATELVATTIDYFLRAPDMVFDLVIFEEASQLRLTGLLKVLSKVIRGRNSNQGLHVILSGDANQLPPFLEPLPICVRDESLLKAYVKAKEHESMLASAIRRHKSCVQCLTVQHRMHPELAMLVNSVFYSDQHWTTSRADEQSRQRAVWWFDSGQSELQAQYERGSTSSFHTLEIEIVQRIGYLLESEAGGLLVITPYLAQAARLEEVLGSRAMLRTIDGCQGIEADILVVSLVRPDSEFVLDPRRLNVALSRARNRLYLVGDLQGFQMVGRKQDAPHILGLTGLFSASGPWADRVIRGDRPFDLPV